MNLVGCKWLNECFVYPAGKAKPTCETITCSKQMRVPGSTNAEGEFRGPDWTAKASRRTRDSNS